MRKLVGYLIALVFLMSSCTFNIQVLTPAPPVTDTQLTPYSTQIAATPVASATPVPVAPTLAPPTTSPIFFNGRAAATSDEQYGPQPFFPTGTKIVYAIWDYQNMREGMQIRREWYLNGQPWLTREETWDFQKYGSAGTMRDVSIRDDVAGLDSGTYHLRIYIDNILQPIGGSIYEPIQEWLTFEIGLGTDESFMGYGSWDGNWGVEVYGGNRVMLKNTITGETRQIVIVQEVPYVTWFNDSKHFLFVDRDRSEQKPGTSIGIRDHLWIVEVPSGEARRVYKGDTSFAGRLGPVPSLDGNYIASLTGSGYGDGCLKDTHLIFFEVPNDFQSVKTVKQEDFTGLPAFNEGWIYPLDDGHWENESSYRVTLDGTCNADKSKLGNFRFDLLNRTASQVSASAGQPIPGDLGVGAVHGQITDLNGVPVENAIITCEQHSYTTSSPCSGSFTTAAEGIYIFNTVYFHDTDTIKLTVRAAGYETKEISQSFFITNDWVANIVLNKAP